MSEERPVRQAPNRPDHIPRSLGILFADTGSTGWGRRRDLRDHKGGKSEANFEHLYDKFTHDSAEEE